MGTWRLGRVARSILLLIRSRFAFWAYCVSAVGIVLSIGYQMTLAPPLQGNKGTASVLMPWLIIVIGVALLLYSRAMTKRGLLR